MHPLVSVVIPTYNRAPELAKALASVMAQTYPHWEALVIDNHSTDNTREVVCRLNETRVKYFEISNNGVIAASRNLGIHRSNGEFIAFLDSDDAWQSDKLERSMFWLNQGFDVVYHDMNIVSNKRFYIGARKFRTRELSSPVFNDLLVNGNTLPTSSVAVRKKLLVEVGGFREDVEIIAGEDYDLWLRLGRATERFKRVEGTLGYLTRGDSNEFSSLRLLSILSEIEAKYILLLSPKEQHHAHVNWIEFSHARSQYLQTNDDAARSKLVKVLTTSNNWSFRIKAVFMLAVIAIRQCVGRRA